MQLPKFNLTFTAKRRLQRAGLISLIVLMVMILIWFCWVIWAERYVVYSREGATINLDLPEQIGGGQVAAPPALDETISIYINEGSDAISTTAELQQISGYYVDQDLLIENIQGVKNTVVTLPSGTAVMLELKNIYGRFNYSSNLSFAERASNVDTAAVDGLITEITSRNLYAIAVIPAFRERNYVIQRNDFFLKTSNGYGWEDEQNCYWLDPSDNGSLNWIMQITEELRTLGFDEVVFTEFRFPSSDRISFSGDRDAIIKQAAQKIVDTCGSANFTVSFVTNDPNFTLPEGGMSRIYLENVGAKDADAAAAKLTVPDPAVNLVFLATTTDTRYDKYSTLRPIVIATNQ